MKILNLNEKDTKIFINALLNPPQPNKNLTEAIKNYFKNVQNPLNMI